VYCPSTVLTASFKKIKLCNPQRTIEKAGENDEILRNIRSDFEIHRKLAKSQRQLLKP